MTGRLDGPFARRVVLAAAVLAQLVALYWPRPVEPGTSLPVDKVVHLAIFGAVMWAGVRAGVRPAPLAAVLAVHAGVSEVVQATLLDRDGNVPDALADLAGVGVGWWVARWRGRPTRDRTLADRRAAGSG